MEWRTRTPPEIVADAKQVLFGITPYSLYRAAQVYGMDYRTLLILSGAIIINEPPESKETDETPSGN